MSTIISGYTVYAGCMKGAVSALNHALGIHKNTTHMKVLTDFIDRSFSTERKVRSDKNESVFSSKKKQNKNMFGGVSLIE